MKILIAIPTYENITPDTFKSVYNLYKGLYKVDFDFVRGYDVASARNNIALATLNGGYDYVLMVDNDVTLPPDALLNLLRTEQDEPERGMVVGYYLQRYTGRLNDSGRTSVFKFGGRDYIRDDAFTEGELNALLARRITRVQIRGCGLGCALIHRSVFERMSYPYFKWQIYNKETHLSEDLYFSEKFKEIGVPIFCDARVRCGHMMRFIA